MALRGKVLITGGTGTLGRAIATVAERDSWPCSITVFSRSELQQAKMKSLFPQLKYVIGDVRDLAAVKAAIAGHDVVVHAAAMKRIPECEMQPMECTATNIVGSYNVAVACSLYGVRRCIGVSTDKAVRASTVYGASKLMLEQIWRAQTTFNGTAYTLVRYGNVVASRGSVLQIWKEQAAKGEPLTVTDVRMTRFWMSPFDAVDLVDRASSLAHGQILVPKAKAMSVEALAKLFAPDAPIIESGLRSVEKMHEDLIHPDEKVQEVGSDFIVGTKSGRKGLTYSSRNADQLSADEIFAMVNDAEKLEW